MTTHGGEQTTRSINRHPPPRAASLSSVSHRRKRSGLSAQSFHPKIAGARLYADTLKAALGKLARGVTQPARVGKPNMTSPHGL